MGVQEAQTYVEKQVDVLWNKGVHATTLKLIKQNLGLPKHSMSHEEKKEMKVSLGTVLGWCMRVLEDAALLAAFNTWNGSASDWSKVWGPFVAMCIGAQIQEMHVTLIAKIFEVEPVVPVVNASGVPSYKSCYKIDSNKGSTFSKKFQKKYQCTAHACNSDSSVQSHARAAPPMPDSTPDRNARCTLLTFLEPQAPRAEIDMPGVPSRAATRERCSITISKIITRARLQCVCLCRADWMSWDHDAL